jgi:hypothetical protein
MNRKAEAIAYVILFLLFGVLFIDQSTQSVFYFYYTVALWICVGVMLAISRLVVAPRITHKAWGYALLYFMASLSFCFFVTGYFYKKYLSDIFKGASVSYLEPLLIKEIVSFLLMAAVIGFLYRVKPRQFLKSKVFYLFLSGISITLIGFVSFYLIDTKYKGDDSIKFIEGKHEILNTLLAQKQFVGKVVYIDLWYSSCAPCIEEFKNMPALKAALQTKNIEYLYLARKTSHPNHLQRWKNAIKQYNLQGWHVYMTDELEENVWRLIENNTANVSRAYPHYLLLDKDNTIVSYHAGRPSDGALTIKSLHDLTSK